MPSRVIDEYSMNYSTYGTAILQVEPAQLVKMVGVSFANNLLVLHLSDGRALQLQMGNYPWLRWLTQATPEERAQWEIVPSGGGIWWPALDDGIELQPLLDINSLLHTSEELPHIG